MRLACDLSVLRQPAAGTTRYAVELIRAMHPLAEADEIVETSGWPRLTRAVPGRRLVNLASELGWLSVGANVVAAHHRVDVWFSPANLLPVALPRPKVVSILDANVVRVRAEYDRGYAAYASWMFRSAGLRADAVLTISDDARGRLIEDLGIPSDRIVVAYPGIDHALRIHPGERPSGLPTDYALFVGQTEPHKNLDRLVAAWGLGVPDGLDLVIAGPVGRGEGSLSSAIQSSPVAHRIHRLGRLSEPGLARVYADATCFVFPSLSEGFGFPPLEAMARGIPTAVADASALPEVTGDGAIRFDPLDPGAIAVAVRRLTEDDSLRARLRVDGATVARRYTWASTATAAWDTIRSVTHA